ncbi:actin-like ATPase domain-containing protein [Aspergillus steynii IBT 23096]|uniref:Actin-like ATPase domain-containing protein n=1 Tax=Aspergillus steynii IBT 23096 TaxID=1392250 RepID=A0A2I2GEA4_9EURO|nr:actin-like ATPase domain-containing protein [Aspergillus steynii IBT 23096]PLB51203.1 actin-like ATPase domain-containing protein [Aspergillus steynii IBT 23096]
MEPDWTPDVVVAVDFGMTCTGIAYSYAPEWPAPKPLQHWPGLMGSELANKVPSRLRYDPVTGQVQTWGFQCEPGSDAKGVFKLNLDPHFVDSRPYPPSRQDAMRWFTDYVHCVYRYVVSYFARTFPRFASRNVEFIFSVPTTWKDPRMVAELRQSIRFDSDSHRATIGLTEAEAAAVHASGQYYQKNDVILVCDAGGGTTDVNVLKLMSNPGEATLFHPLSCVEGKAVGSSLIDAAACQLLAGRLECIRDILSNSPQNTAWELIMQQFQRFKCNFGSEMMDGSPLIIDIPGLAQETSFPAAGIENGQIIITQDELQHLFDARIDEVHSLLDEQIRLLQVTNPQEKISFLVLSGGFGSSPYVRKRLKDRYQNPGTMSSLVEVLTVDEPQLAVVQGQIMNRVQQLKQGASAFNSLYSRVSYGVICDQLHDANRHLREPVRFDERDGKKFAVGQIDWLVLQGDAVPRTGVSKEFRRKIYPRDMARPWVAQIVMSTLPPGQIPQSMSHPGASLICNIEVDMTSVDRKSQNHRWYHRNQAHFLASFTIRMVVGPNDLEFELWNKSGGRIRSHNRDPITVKWNPPVEAEDGSIHRAQEMPGDEHNIRPTELPAHSKKHLELPGSDSGVKEVRHELPGDFGPSFSSRS